MRFDSCKDLVQSVSGCGRRNRVLNLVEIPKYNHQASWEVLRTNRASAG